MNWGPLPSFSTERGRTGVSACSPGRDCGNARRDCRAGFRVAVASCYGPARLWKSVGRIERGVRILRRSCQMEPMLASIAQNPLHGIFHRFPKPIRDEVYAYGGQWINAAMPPSDPAAGFWGLDVALTCGNIFAQKTKPPFEAAGWKVAFPFLDQRMVGLAFQRASRWPGRDGTQARDQARRSHRPCLARWCIERRAGSLCPWPTSFGNLHFCSRWIGSFMASPPYRRSSTSGDSCVWRTRLKWGGNCPPQRRIYCGRRYSRTVGCWIGKGIRNGPYPNVLKTFYNPIRLRRAPAIPRYRQKGGCDFGLSGCGGDVRRRCGDSPANAPGNGGSSRSRRDPRQRLSEGLHWRSVWR